jgi:hypothetical protein
LAYIFPQTWGKKVSRKLGDSSPYLCSKIIIAAALYWLCIETVMPSGATAREAHMKRNVSSMLRQHW